MISTGRGANAHLHLATMVSVISRGVSSRYGPRMASSMLGSARAVSSVPHSQAGVADISNALGPSSGSVAPVFDTTPLREAASPVPPVVSPSPYDRDEFWRRVPVWESVSAQDFLSYRWNVSLSVL
jgi:lysine 2,3-aminomutase